VIDRRTWLLGAGASAACAMLPLTRAVARGANWPIGVQLWSVQSELQRDLEGTLAKLRAIGFQKVETAGWLGRDPVSFGKAVRTAGLDCDSAHIDLPSLARDMAGAVSAARDAGCRYLMVASPQPPAPLKPGPSWLTDLVTVMTPEAWHTSAALIDKASRLAQQAGITLGYHNHIAEFAGTGDDQGMAILLSKTDPKLVKLELDVAWAIAAGQDAAALIKTHGKRVVRLHLKDLKAKAILGQVSSNFDQVAIGQGTIYWAAIIAATRGMAIAGAYLEVDPPHQRPALDILRESLTYLTKLRTS
jgi:sugar phosphate isomerase/epimerase